MGLPVSLRNVAEVAGVSVTTVSLALRNHPKLPESTRARIRALADEMGYVPNAEVSKAMGYVRDRRPRQDFPVLGIITDGEVMMSREAALSDTWRGYAERTRALGYRPEEFWLGDGSIRPDRLVGILKTRGIRGFVISALRDSKVIERMDLSHFATAVIGHALHNPRLHRSSSDKHTNTLLICERLWAMGCRRLALAVPKWQEDRVEHLFLSGYLLFHYLNRHAGWEVPLVDEDSWHPPRIAQRVREWGADGVVAAYPGLETLLPGVPVALVNVMRSGMMGIDQRHDRIAAGAVDLVDAQIKRNEMGVPANAKTMLVVGDWSATSAACDRR